MPDESYLVRKKPRDVVLSVARADGIPDDIADDFVKVSGLESGSSHYDRKGRVKQSPVDPKDGQRAVGFSQIKPATAKSVGITDPYNEVENVRAGLRYYAKGGADPVRRRIAYFSGTNSKSVQHYDRTGRIPSGGDFTGTSFQKYIAGTGGLNQQKGDPYLAPKPKTPRTAPAAEDPYLVAKPVKPIDSALTATVQNLAQKAADEKRRKDTQSKVKQIRSGAFGGRQASVDEQSAIRAGIDAADRPKSIGRPFHRPAAPVPSASMSARTPSTWERIKETVAPYVPGLTSLDTPGGIKTDLPRGIASGLTLGAIEPREISQEERILDPNAGRGAVLPFEAMELSAFNVGQLASAVVPYLGAAKVVNKIKALQVPTRSMAAARTGLTFGSVETAREAIQAGKTGDFRPEEILISTAIGMAMGGIPAAKDPSIKARLVAALLPQATADVTRGVPLPQAVMNAVTNLGFEVSGIGRRAKLAEAEVDPYLVPKPEVANEVKVETQPEVARPIENAPVVPAERTAARVHAEGVGQVVPAAVEAAERRLVRREFDRIKESADRPAEVVPAEVLPKEAAQPADSTTTAPSLERRALTLREPVKPVEPETVGGLSNAQIESWMEQRGAESVNPLKIQQRFKVSPEDAVRIADHIKSSRAFTQVLLRGTLGRMEKEDPKAFKRFAAGIEEVPKPDPEARQEARKNILGRLDEIDAEGAVRSNADTSKEIERAQNFMGQKHTVAKYLSDSPLRAEVLRELPEGSVLAGPNADAPEMHQAAIRLRSPNGAIWEVDLSYDRRGDSSWKIIGPRLDGFAVRKTGEVQAIPAPAPTEQRVEVPAKPVEAQVVRPWEMTREQIEQEFQRKKAEDDNLEVAILGPDLAKKYARLQRAANSSYDVEKANRASDEIERIEASLSERDRNRLYGIGEEGPQLDDLRSHRQSLSNLDDTDPQSLAQSMRWAVSRVGNESDPLKMTQEQQIAYGTLREAARIAHERGWDTQAISREAVKAAGERFSDPEDAAFILDRFIKKKPSPTQPKRQALPAAQMTPPISESAAVKPAKEVVPSEATEVATRSNQTITKMAEGVGEPAPSVTSARKEMLRGDRESLDLPELPPAERKAWQETLDNAKTKKIDERASLLADEVLNKPRGLNDEESAGLVLRAQQIKNEHGRVMKEIGDATSPESIQAKRAEAEALEREFDKLSQATKASGTQNARALAAHKLTINQDFDLVSLIQRAKAARGRELKPEERAKLEQQATRISELEGQLAEAHKTAEAKAIQKDIERVRRQTKRGETKKVLDDEFAVLRQEFAQARAEVKSVQPSGLASLDPEGTLTPIILKMARNRVKAGTVKVEEVIDQIHSAIAEHVDVSKDELRTLLSGHNLERDPLPAIKTRLGKQEAELTRQLETKDFSKPPPRKKPIYDKEASDLKARVESLKRKVEDEIRGTDSRLDTAIAMWKAGLLTGPKTHVRNIGGTAGFQVFEEVARIPGAVTDLVTSAFTGRRTLGAPDPVAVAKSSYEAATKGIREAKQIMKYGATGEELKIIERPREVNSGSKIIDAYTNTVFRTLGAEDKVFRVYAYKRSMIEQSKLKAKGEGKTAKELEENPTAEMVSQAILDSEVATFNNQNAAATGVEWVRQHSGPVGKTAIDLIVPFRRTPANIMTRLLESTPLGLVKGAGQLTRDVLKKKFDFEAQRKFSQTIGRSVTGSSLIAFGAWLASQGLATGLYESDRGDREVQEAAGRSPMAVRIGDTWHQVGAFSPIGNLLAIGAALYREKNRPPKEGEEPGNVVTAALPVTAKTMLEQPMLRGVSGAVDAIKEPGTRGSTFVGRTLGSAVPTIVSDAASLVDDKRRETRSIPSKIQVRVPFLRNRLPEDVDVFGRPLESRRTGVVDPTITTSAKDDPFIKELIRLDVGIVKTNRKPGESEAEHRKRVTAQGKEIASRLSKIVTTPRYRAASDEIKREIIKDVIEGARKATNSKFSLSKKALRMVIEGLRN